MLEQASKPPESSSLTSATAVPLPPEAADLYCEVLVALNEHGVEYAVAGAFALQAWSGVPTPKRPSTPMTHVGFVLSRCWL